MEEGVFPLNRSLFDDTALEEERRLAYVGITRAKQKLYISHAHTRALYNTRNANQISRFVSEIPHRLIQEGQARMNSRIPQAGARISGDGPSAPRYSYQSPAQTRPAAAAKVGGVSIPGIQKGFGGAKPAAPGHGLRLFRPGDRVIHAVFGKGIVQDIEGEGSAQKVIVRFNATGQLKRFSANIAPLRKIDD